MYEFLLLAHLLIFVYWLGADLGVFYSSGFVVNTKLSREARLTAAKIMLGCDLVPRICMSLTLTVGGLLSHYTAIEHHPLQLAAIVSLGPVWLSAILILHFRHSAPYIPLLTKVDFYFRCILIITIIASVAYALTTDRLDDAPWLAAKLIGFALAVFCGLMIRVKIIGFSNTYVKIVQGSYTDSDNRLMADSLSAVRPWVFLIWAILIAQAALGIIQPGS